MATVECLGERERDRIAAEREIVRRSVYYSLGVPSCLFCSASLDDAWATNEYGIALPATQPVAPGHVVVAPRRHVAAFYDLDITEQRGLWLLVLEVRKYLVGYLNVESAAVGFADCEGDEGHTHIHVVPRRPGIELPAGIEWVND
jgi:diadenosine tetraphosphate (Ap4A) HIT family hydrolase